MQARAERSSRASGETLTPFRSRRFFWLFALAPSRGGALELAQRNVFPHDPAVALPRDPPWAGDRM